MGIQVAVNHRTSYEYDRQVNLSPHIIRLRPAPHCRTPVRSYSLRIDPPEHFLNWQQDPHGNYLARAVFQTPARRLRVEVDLVAEMTVINPFDFFLESAETFPFEYEPWLARDLRPYLETEPPGPELRKFLAAVDSRPRRTVDFLVALNQQVQRRVDYLIRMEPGIQTCDDTLARGSGSCRDSAWLLAQVLRQMGLAARFVSGYLIQLVPDVKPLDGPAGPPRDFTDLHAWTEVYLPGAGWVGLDPTSGMFAAEGHLPVAATAEPATAAPISGSVSPAEAEFVHTMTVTRLSEAPRVTRPYSEAAWSAIDGLGRAIDRTLADNDVRLTMGGEPTFVSVDDMEGAEWNYDALGPAKRRLSEQLLRRLQPAFAPGGLLHDGQGKRYPGEPLPRWALGCYWRTDGQPLWRNRALLADLSHDYGHGPAHAERLIRTLAERVGASPDYVVAAYEDPLPHLRGERELPVNLPAGDPRLQRPEHRERLRRVLEQDLGRPVGYVLPLSRSSTGARMWQSGLWLLRGKHLLLVPGDSPAGLRLPLDSLPWVDPRHAAPVIEQDPLAPRPPLPARDILPRRGIRPAAPVPGPRDRTPATGESADWVVRTALVVQPRDGRLHVFLPPLANADDYVDLLARVEDTAAELDTPVVIEGYPPPSDPRLSVVKVTPDPGVIEVNTHPAHSWEELVSTTTTLYDAARATRLGTETFLLDGRHSGTGGGNHVVLGGPTAADSPFLRRPDLLRSLVAYWINHPSLSYLFSGLFIGPTSQAPRVDETRSDSMAEIEIAFEQIDGSGPDCPPWLVDRVFRHLLVDVTGNTHRAEFCIDKLYAPETASGRQGLVELRAFEMPPHPRMSLTQQLLLRGLVAWCWTRPYRRPVVHWGARLHDEFMLPHYVRRDFDTVIGDLREAGFPFETDWFDAHFEFRYPRIGRVAHADIELELRTAAEPWYILLGEEPHGGATTRYVDSSVERLQVLVRGAVDRRHVVTCNRRRVPLHPTGTDSEFAAGVRYRAWQPPSCLHPTIGVHTPLTFDIADTWSGRSIGGCTYHVSHPGGLSPETFPINAAEAEARRVARFFPFGHTPGPFEPGPLETNPAAPHTLDLRRAAPAGPSPEPAP